ncbi:MAG: cyclopropane-fatty-acyl-phospholipid synthase [Gammaproteobacteria bacterium]|nr:MAG: cyclopropane-fatty-acyl-phospholipid synthase [Gammaproteobacteria bacterium]
MSQTASEIERGAAPAPEPPVRGRSRPWDRRLLRAALDRLGRPPLAVRLWDGHWEAGEAGTEPRLRLAIADRAALLGVLLDPEDRFGDLYSEGRIELVEGELVDLLTTLYRHAPPDAAWRKPRRHLRRWLRSANGLRQARRNIHHHYDIGNRFYALWLDPHMQYTCAYFPEPGMSLEQAQVAKMEHICRKLQLCPGDRVVEAGCGWGGLARYMAKHYGVHVTAYNISHEQVQYARQRALQEGLADRVHYVEDDYRNIQGEYDVFVSVGMLEHVGPKNYPTLGAVIDRCLTPEGRGLIHSIGRNRPRPMNSWIERRIFPGAHPPALREMMAIFESGGLSVLDVENLRLHYEETLRHWLARFEANVLEVRSLYDEAFVRAWRVYLSGSIAAFHCGELQLFQVVFARATNNRLPRNRAHLYRDPLPQDA